jgi:hypothetical protein
MPPGSSDRPSIRDTISAYSIATGYLEDCEIEEHPTPSRLKAPEPTKRVKVLAPFSVSHNGNAYWPNAVAEVPQSVDAFTLGRRRS